MSAGEWERLTSVSSPIILFPSFCKNSSMQQLIRWVKVASDLRHFMHIVEREATRRILARKISSFYSGKNYGRKMRTCV
jgi:hypothetical protein